MSSFKSVAAASAALAVLVSTTSAIAVDHSLHKRNSVVPAPPCTLPFTNFNFVGCYVDPSAVRALPFDAGLDFNTMTPSKCIAACKGNGYRYAGLEYYGQCFCGGAIGGPVADPSSCSYACTGDPNSVCGGNDFVSVYQDPTFPTVDDTVITDYSNLGCYSQIPGGSALAYKQTQLDPTTITTEKCLSTCKSLGFPLAGTMYADECYCGNVLGNGTAPTAATDCNMACSGNANETCGGSLRLNLYVAQDLESSQPCGPNAQPSPSVSTSLSSTASSSSSSSTGSSTSSMSVTSSGSSTATSTGSSTSSTGSSTSSTGSSTSSTGSSTSSTGSSTSTTGSSTSSTGSSTSSTGSSTSSTGSSASSTGTSSSSSSSSTPASSSSSTPASSSSSSSTPASSSSSTPASSSSSTPASSSSSTSAISSCSTSASVTSKPTSSSSMSTSVTKTGSSTCVVTQTAVPTCEYKIGNWCALPMPPFKDQNTCVAAATNCFLQASSCFSSAGWPAALNCFDFLGRCGAYKNYCNQWGGASSKGDCDKKNPIPPSCQPPNPPVIGSCPTTVPVSTSSMTPTSTTPVPSTTNICVIPSGPPGSGYEGSKCVGNIPAPQVGCNNQFGDWQQNPFKLYSNQDTRQCGSYTRNNVPQACQDACKNQLQSCQGTYAQNCRGGQGPEGYGSAQQRCNNQYNDCINANRQTSCGGCRNFGQ